MWMKIDSFWVPARAKQWLGDSDGDAFYLTPAVHLSWKSPLVLFIRQGKTSTHVVTIFDMKAWKRRRPTREVWREWDNVWLAVDAYSEVGWLNDDRCFLCSAVQKDVNPIPGCVLVKGEPWSNTFEIIGEWLNGSTEPGRISENLYFPGIEKKVAAELAGYLRQET